MTLEETKRKIEEKIRLAPHLKGRVKFDFGADGVLFADATQSPASVQSGDGTAEPDTTLACSLATFSAILEGRQDPNIAFMTGKLKVKGSMGLAMKLNSILED